MSAYNLGTASGRIEIDGRGAGAGFKVAETAADAFFSVVQAKMDSVQQLGRRLTAVGTTGVGGIGLAIKTAASFQQQMSGVQAVTNSTGDEFDALREKAMQLGADTTFSASEAALAIEELAKAGIPVEDILNGAAEGAVALAAAGGVGLEEAATIAANAMNQFGLGADKVSNVADILAGVANTSAADVSSIGTSLSQAGAVANLAGLSFRDTAIAIGEMADAGINGSDAGTSLKTMLNNLIPTTSKQIKKFKELGLLTYNLGDANKALMKITGQDAQKSIEGVTGALAEYVEGQGQGNIGTVKNATAVQDLMMQYGGLNNQFFDAQGNIKKLGGLQGTLGKALAGMTKQQKLATLETLFGADAMRATAILSLEGAKGYKEFSKAVGETSAADVAKTRLNNLAGATEAMKGSFETAMITIGNIFLPIVTKIVQGITWLINAFNKLPNSVKTGIAIFAAIASTGMLVVGMILALLPVILGMIANFLLMRSLGIVVTGLRTLWTALRTGQGVMAATRLAALTTGTSFLRMGKMSLLGGKMMVGFAKVLRIVGIAMKFALGPWGLLIIGIIAALVLLYKKFAPFRDLVNSVGAAIRGGFNAALNGMKTAVAATVAAFTRFGGFLKATLLPVLRSVGQFLVGKLLSGWGEIKTAVADQLMPALKQLAAAFNGDVLPVLQSVGGAIASFGAAIASKALPFIMALGRVFIENVLPILIKVGGFLGGFLIDTIVSLVKGIIQAVSGIIQIFTGLINFVKGVFTGNWSQAWNGIKQIFSGILDLIVGVVKVALQVGVLKVFGTAMRAVGALVRVGWGAIVSIFKASGTRIVGFLRGIFNRLMGLVRGGMNVIRGVFSKVWGAIRSAIMKVVNAIVNGIKAWINTQKAIVTGGLNTIKNVFTTIWNTIRTLIVKAWTNIKTAVTNGVTNMIGVVKSIPGKVLSALGDLGSLLKDAGAKLIQGLIDGISSKIAAVTAKMSELAGKIKGFLPGSPIETGPLKSWNRGGAGSRLMQTLQEGIKREEARTALAAERAAMAVGSAFNKNIRLDAVSVSGALLATSTPSQNTALLTPSAPKRPLKKKPVSGKSRMVEGTLYIDPSGRAWIRGIAEDVVDETGEDNNRHDRMG